MKGLKIIFSKTDSSIDTENYVEGFDTAVQNALVNIATQAGTDKIYSEKGTSLLKTALEGKIVGFTDSTHEAQIAALDTLFFSRAQDVGLTGGYRLGQVNLQPLEYVNNSLKITAAFTDLNNSRTVGTVTTL